MKKIFLFLVIALAIIAGVKYFIKFGVNNLKSEDIKRYLNKVIVDGSDSLYLLEIKDYEVNSELDGARISGVKISINQKVFDKQRAENTLPEIIFDASFENLYLEGVEILSLIKKNKDIVVKNIRLEGAEVKVYPYKKVKKDTAKAPIISNLYDRIKKDINSIAIKNIEVNGAKMTYDPKGKMDKVQPFWKFEDISLTFKDLLVDSTSATDTTRLLYAKEFNTVVKNFKGEMGNNMYKFAMGQCAYNYNNQLLEISNLSLTPIVSHAQFFKNKGEAVSEATIKIPTLKVAGFQSLQLIRDSMFKAESVSLNKGNFGLYKDKSFGDPPVSKNGQYPNQLLYNLPFAIDIRQLNIINADLTFTEKSYKTKKEGVLRFGNINGTLTNITNVPSMVSSNAWTELKANATFQGSSPMTARLAFDLRNDQGNFEADATLTGLKPEQINPVIKNLGMAQTESFNLKSLNYRSKGNTKSATGSMELIYSDLKVDFLEKDEETKQVKEKKVISLLANVLKVRTDNPNNKDEVKAVNIFTERPFFRGFFALVWFNIFDCTVAITINGKAPDMLKKGRTLEGIPGGGVEKPTEKEEKEAKKEAKKQKKEDRKGS